MTFLVVMNGSESHFDKIAETYDRTLPEHVREHYLHKRLKLLAPLLQGGKGLDVGCGTGLLLAALGPYGKVVGVDASPGMIAILKREGRGEAVVGRTEHLPFDDGQFDLVFCVALLHHVAAPDLVRQTVREMLRVAKPGGRLVIWDHNPRNPYWPHLMKRMPQDTGAERLIPAAEITGYLLEAGASEVRTTHSGFVPDFTPRWLMPVARAVEWVLERTPLLHGFAAHNVIVARKRDTR